MFRVYPVCDYDKRFVNSIPEFNILFENRKRKVLIFFLTFVVYDPGNLSFMASEERCNTVCSPLDSWKSSLFNEVS